MKLYAGRVDSWKKVTLTPLESDSLPHIRSNFNLEAGLGNIPEVSADEGLVFSRLPGLVPLRPLRP